MRADELKALAERVMRLDGPCRETDEAVGFAIGYRKSHGQWWSPQQHAEARRKKRSIWSVGMPAKLPSFTASLDAAMTLVPENMREGVLLNIKATAQAMIFRNGDGVMGEAIARTPALALTAAALLAKAAHIEGEGK